MASYSAETSAHMPPPNWTQMRSTPYSKLKTGLKRKIGVYLSAKQVVAADWVILAEALGLARDEIELIRLEGNKDNKIVGEIMLDSWSRKGDSSTVKVLEDQLIALDRRDVLDLLYQSAQPLCQLTCTVVMDQENTVDLPREDLHVPEQDILKVALDNPLQKIGLKPDDLYINPVADKEITWETEAHLLKGYHLYLYKTSTPVQETGSPQESRTENDYDDVEVPMSPTEKSADADDIYENLTVNLGWHQHLPDNRFEIIRVMKDYLKADGYFIIRRTKRNDIAVSVTYLGKIRHFRIYQSKNQYYFYRSGERKDSIAELLMYYRDNALTLHKNKGQVRESSNGGAPPLPPRVALNLKYPVVVDRALEESHRTLKY